MASFLLSSKKGVNLDALDAMGLTRPMSSAARVHGAMSVLMRQGVDFRSKERAAVIIKMLEVLKQSIVGEEATAPSLGDAWMWRTFSAAAGLAQVRAVSLPDPDPELGIIPPLPDDIVDDTSLATGVSCPIWANSSCFIDTLLVMMFAGTTAFDTAFWTNENAYVDLPTSTSLQDATSEYEPCSSADDDLRERQELQGAVRQFVTGMRTGADESFLTSLVAVIRQSIGECGAIGTTTQEDISDVFTRLMRRTTMEMHYLAPITLTIKMLKRINVFGETITLRAPFPYSAGARGPSGGPIELRASKGTLQQVLRQSFGFVDEQVANVVVESSRLKEHAIEYGDEKLIKAMQLLGANGDIRLDGVHDGFDATHTVHLPSSGVLPLYYAADPTTERNIDIGIDRTFTVRTIDGTVHMYRVFAVALWAGAATGKSGHYWSVLWQGEQMYYYNDSTPIGAGPMLQKIERFERPPVDLGMTADEEVRRHGILYLSKRVG